MATNYDPRLAAQHAQHQAYAAQHYAPTHGQSHAHGHGHAHAHGHGQYAYPEPSPVPEPVMPEVESLAERPFEVPDYYQINTVVGEGAYGVVW